MKLYIYIVFTILIYYCKTHTKSSETFVPGKNSVFGIDISGNQGNINWAKVKDWKGNKINFIYIKATEGTTFIDEQYKKNILGAKGKGFLVGSYHYFRTTSNPKTQFENFIKNADKEKQDLIPLVDVEEKEHWDDKTFHKNFKLFLELVEHYYGKKPLIYTVNSFYNLNLSGKYKDYQFLIGRYGKNSPNMRDKHNWAIWQFSESGRIEGISKPIDIDVLSSKIKLKSLLLKDEKE